MKLDANELPHLVAGVCLEVHRQLGPGLPAPVYRDCLDRELRLRELVYQRNSPLPIWYRGERLSSAEIAVDFVIEDQLVLLVSAEEICDVDPNVSGRRELETYLRLSGLGSGLWVNFNVADLRHGMRRLVSSPREAAAGAGGIGAGASRN